MSLGGRGGRGGGGRGGGRGGSMMMMGGLASEVGMEPLFPVEANAKAFPEIAVEKQRDPTSEEQEEIERAKDLIKAMHASPFYLLPLSPAPDIERYSDRYKVKGTERPALSTVLADVSFYPEELHSVHNPKAKKKEKQSSALALDVVSELDHLVKEDEAGDLGDGKGEGQDGRDGEGEAEETEDLADDFDDEDEENDYVEEYFDNGEGDGDLDDDGGGGGGDDY
ncbi:DNA-directed RNA polymerase III, subunit Rpc31 [Piptocephalis cylindrospora]|uniref:DNA-directed RNA polymerase III subunit n=1 Tax=Piptocephalis cylindrospora TaxID=1907219 RepID=A0A4P9Y7Z7_9FUNG|nr:DNA-directed RNA polymerase III, subunit Rpc31 [Piptocephalis cylindrospora]|eukprot:RKP15287.1 DNA-directed RNA polymerase III, subunit Rpc31 [Piptocephalis cylindrospora]